MKEKKYIVTYVDWGNINSKEECYNALNKKEVRELFYSKHSINCSIVRIVEKG